MPWMINFKHYSGLELLTILSGFLSSFMDSSTLK
uniref:Uncharacterized protein n=1 Tax=Arundo donax TaxID=35708 RepID=A0A0A8Y718_ARUDO